MATSNGKNTQDRTGGQSPLPPSNSGLPLFQEIARKPSSSEYQINYHFHPGQKKAIDSERRFILALAGTQGGKTVLGPPWLWREIARCGPGDYLVAAPTYPLLHLKALPEFLRLFQTTLGYGNYIGSPNPRFIFNEYGCRRLFGRVEPTTVHFGHANQPDSLESFTAKAAWLDEAGQSAFKLASWEAIQRRLSIHQGRALITTTPYNLGWLKSQVYDRWQNGDTDYDVIRFDSTENPAFPRKEFDRARDTLPRWKFDLFYRAVFSRPAGLIYDCFDPAIHLVPRFSIPADWPRYLGLDFGGVHTAGIFLAEDPRNGKLYAYREYLAGGKTAMGHVESLMHREPGIPVCAGGAKSEQQWRDEFCAAGLPIYEPAVHQVEVGIDRVYGAFQQGRLFIFNDLVGLIDELNSYSRVVDDQGNPLEEIADKETFHRADSLRYIVPAIVAPLEDEE